MFRVSGSTSAVNGDYFCLGSTGNTGAEVPRFSRMQDRIANSLYDSYYSAGYHPSQLTNGGLVTRKGALWEIGIAVTDQGFRDIPYQGALYTASADTGAADQFNALLSISGTSWTGSS